MVFKGDDDEGTLMMAMIVWQAGYINAFYQRLIDDKNIDGNK